MLYLTTSHQSTMGYDRLNGLALMLINRDAKLNSDAVIEMFLIAIPTDFYYLNVFPNNVLYDWLVHPAKTNHFIA